KAETELAKADYGLKLTTIQVPRFVYAGEEAKQPSVGELKTDADGTRPKRKFMVLERKVELGQNVDAKQPLFTLAANLSQMQAHALIPESQIDRVAKDQNAVFWTDAIGEDHKQPAKVTEIRPMPPATTQGAVYYEVLFNVQNPKHPKRGGWMLKPGMTA